MKNSPGHIRYLTREEIDIAKWDDCILHARNGLIYAHAFYLDAMAEHWSALVEDDYNRVMPLTWNKKFGFPYLYQPYFTKTLGVFGNGSIPFEISSFLHSIPKKFKLWDIDINEENFISDSDRNVRLKKDTRTNYFLSLHQTYDLISSRYKRLAKRAKKKAGKNLLQIDRSGDPASVILLHRLYGSKQPDIPTRVYDRFVCCADLLFKNKQATGYTALSSTGETLAWYLVFTDRQFVYSVLGGSTAAGKKTGAFYLLTDAIIQDHAGTEKIFRFEGSDIPGIAFFNALFNPVAVEYQHVKMNRLPFPVNLFK
jgi:hypothetical protein